MHLFDGDMPYRRQAWRPRIGQGAATQPTGTIPIGTQPSPTPVSAPVGEQPLPAPAPATDWGSKLLLSGGVALGSGIAWLGMRVGQREKKAPLKVAGYGLAAIGAAKALWDLGSLVGWPPSRFPA